MRIGYDAKRLFHNTTGLGNYSRDLVRIMARYYPENHYYLYNPKPSKLNRLKLSENMKMRQPQGRLSQKVPAIWRSKLVNKDLIKDDLDLYHGLSGELPFGISKTGLKTVVTIHDLIFLKFPKLYNPIDRKLYALKFKYAANNADQVVAISEQTKKDIVEYFKINPKKIQVIYQGCHRAFKQNYSDDFKKQILEKYKLPSHFILNVGTIEPRKNAMSIVKALKNTDFQLVLIGRQTAYADKIKNYIHQHQMTHQVHFLEGLGLEELAVLYQLADIFIYPSIYEGFGIPIIEALYSKTPVITNKNGVFSEAAGPYSYYLDDIYDVQKLQEQIKNIYQNYEVNRIQKSYQFVQKFNDDKIAEQWQNLYLKLSNK